MVNAIQRYLAAAISGFLIAIPFNIAEYYLLLWIGFIPLLWSLESSSLRQAYLQGLCCGLVTYALSTSWMIDFVQLYNRTAPVASLPISAIYWLYCAQLPALLCVVYRWLTRASPLSPLLIFPICTSVFFAFYPSLLSVQLGESQSEFLIALQATDITGVYGLDFIIALFNVCLFYLLFKWKEIHRSVLISAGVISAWMIYGFISLNHWDHQITHWPTQKIGIVQPHESPSAELPPPEPGYSRAYPPEMALTEQLVTQGANIVIWPETRYKGYYRYQHIQQAFNRQAKQLNTVIVFQDTERDNDNRLFNTASIITPATGQHLRPLDKYRKYHRVPFGEYIPVLDLWPAMKPSIYPYLDSFFTDYHQGEGPTAFNLASVSLIPVICYEVMFSRYVAQAIGMKDSTPTHSGKILLGLTNNGWFGQSQQPYQHINASLLRSVENRVPMIHATNNGPSLITLPSGRRLTQTPYHQRLALLTEIPIPPSFTPSFYSQYPGWFATLNAIVFLMICLLRLMNKPSKKDE